MSTQQVKLTAIADAIRNKKGTTDYIVANDFASEILSIATLPQPSKYYINKIYLTKDHGYAVEKIPVTGGQVIDLGVGLNVEASTGWEEGIYNMYSHPEMTFQGWSCPFFMEGNVVTMPDKIYTDITIGCTYITTDGNTWFVDFTAADGYTVTVQSGGTVVKGGNTSSAASQTLIGCYIGSGVTLGQYAFSNCEKLLTVTIPSDTILPYYMFKSATRLEYIVMPYLTNPEASSSSLTSIPSGFAYSTNSVCYISTAYGMKYARDYMFRSMDSLKSLTFPETLSSITDYGVAYSKQLTTIVIPTSITSIEDLAFVDTQSLQVVVMESITPPTLKMTNAFNSMDIVILVPEGSLGAYKAATNWSSLIHPILENTLENRTKYRL